MPAAFAKRPTGSRRRGSWWGWLAGFLIVVVGAEGFVRAAGRHLPQPQDYFSGPSQIAVEDMDVLRAAGIRSDVTFVGTSMVRRDVESNLVEKELPGFHFANNLALPGAQTTVVKRWLLEEVVPRIHPKRVVWGVSSLDFNSGRPDHPIDQYDAARATQNGFYGDADRIMWNSELSHHRNSLRDPFTLYAAAGGHAKQFVRCTDLDVCATWKLGFKNRTATHLAKMRRAHAKTIRTRQLRNFTIGVKELAAFRDTLAQLHRQHIEAVVVIMPVTKGYVRFHPHGQADYARWKRVAMAAARQEHATVIDMWNAVPNRKPCDDHEDPNCDFRDYEHLWQPAAKRFTHRLIQQLKALGW